jgi:hypothetical protein
MASLSLPVINPTPNNPYGMPLELVPIPEGEKILGGKINNDSFRQVRAGDRALSLTGGAFVCDQRDVDAGYTRIILEPKKTRRVARFEFDVDNKGRLILRYRSQVCLPGGIVESQFDAEDLATLNRGKIIKVEE